MEDILDRMIRDAEEEAAADYMDQRSKADARARDYARHKLQAEGYRPSLVTMASRAEDTPDGKLRKLNTQLDTILGDPGKHGLTAAKAKELEDGLSSYIMRNLQASYEDVTFTKLYGERGSRSYLSTIAGVTALDCLNQEDVLKMDLDKAAGAVLASLNGRDTAKLVEDAARDMPGNIIYEDGKLSMTLEGAAYAVNFGNANLDDGAKGGIYANMCHESVQYAARVNTVYRAVRGVNATFERTLEENKSKDAPGYAPYGHAAAAAIMRDGCPRVVDFEAPNARGGTGSLAAQDMRAAAELFDNMAKDPKAYGLPDDPRYLDHLGEAANMILKERTLALSPDPAENMRSYAKILDADYALNKKRILPALDSALGRGMQQASDRAGLDALIASKKLDSRVGFDPARTQAGNSYLWTAVAPDAAEDVAEFLRKDLKGEDLADLNRRLEPAENYLAESAEMKGALGELYALVESERQKAKEGRAMDFLNDIAPEETSDSPSSVLHRRALEKKAATWSELRSAAAGNAAEDARAVEFPDRI